MTFPMKKTIITFLLLLPAVVQAQEVTDTLNAAIKTGDRRVSRRIGELGQTLPEYGLSSRLSEKATRYGGSRGFRGSRPAPTAVPPCMCVAGTWATTCSP